MFGISMWEIMLVVLVLLALVGPAKIPELARSVGKAFGSLRRSVDDVKKEVNLDGELNFLKEVKKEVKQDVNVYDVLADADPTAPVPDLPKGPGTKEPVRSGREKVKAASKGKRAGRKPAVQGRKGGAASGGRSGAARIGRSVGGKVRKQGRTGRLRAGKNRRPPGRSGRGIDDKEPVGDLETADGQLKLESAKTEVSPAGPYVPGKPSEVQAQEEPVEVETAAGRGGGLDIADASHGEPVGGPVTDGHDEETTPDSGAEGADESGPGSESLQDPDSVTGPEEEGPIDPSPKILMGMPVLSGDLRKKLPESGKPDGSGGTEPRPRVTSGSNS